MPVWVIFLSKSLLIHRHSLQIRDLDLLDILSIIALYLIKKPEKEFTGFCPA
jgi:hypothetical protein